MKAIKEKLHDISGMRHAKAQAKEEARAEKESHEKRVARGKEAEMDLHKAKAADKVVQHQQAKLCRPSGAGDCATVCPIRR